MTEPMQTEERDTLRIYGMSFDFPVSQKLEFDPKFTREGGSVAVKSPTKSVIFVTWGELQKIVKKLPTPREHSKYSMERAAKSARGKLNRVEEKDVRINGHPAAYARAEIEVPRGMIGPQRPKQEIISVHFHCDRSARYFVIYTSTDWGGRDAEGRDEVFRIMLETFRCH
jgi:hypothetical protein